MVTYLVEPRSGLGITRKALWFDLQLLRFSHRQTDLQGTEDKDMKITMSTILVFMISTAQAFAGTPQQIGAWSVIPATDNHSNAVLIQTASDSAGAKLDLICRKGKIWKVVVETSI